MAHRKCTICGEEIVLIPSAAERSRKTGKPAKYFLDLYPTHTNCWLDQRSREDRELAERLRHARAH